MINVVVDLSHHNANPDFDQAAEAGILGVIYKASQGVSWVDSTYAAAEPKARAAGLMWGAYHFGDGSDGVAQAQNFLSRLGDPANTLMVLDFEENPGGASMTLDQARAFITHIHDQTGQYPGFYSGSYIKQQLGDAADPLLAQCWFWLAQYGPTAVVPQCWPTWTMWQYTDGTTNADPQTIPGLGKCDRDRFNGDEAGLRRLWPS